MTTVTRMSEEGIVFVISGPSGSGKGTVVDILRTMCTTVGVSVSATSRLPREGEREGVNYYYKTRGEFEELIARGEVLEHTEYNGNYYGTLKSEAERITREGRDIILEIETDGCRQIRELMGENCVTVMLTAPTYAELEERLRSRGTESEDAIAGRLRRAADEISQAEKYNYVVINRHGQCRECAAEILAIITAEHLKSKRCASRVADEFWNKNNNNI